MATDASREPRRLAVVGGSLAGLEATKALRREGFDGDLVVFAAEEVAPYDRPPLSKALLAGRVAADDVLLELGEAADAEWRLGRPATGLDARRLAVRAGTAAEERFDGIVIATGAAARRPSFAGELGASAGVHTVRDRGDCEALAAELAAGPGRVVVIGAGFIGCEVASTCRELALPVTVLEAMAAPLLPVLGHQVGTALAELQVEHGVDLRLGSSVAGLVGTERVEAVELGDGTRVKADVVVISVGVEPNVDWLRDSGLTVEAGVLCDETCLAAPGIVAAGDVARWPNPRFGEVRRVEHWDNAIRQAQHAARRLLDPGGGAAAPYEPVPWFWSDQFGSKLQMVGSTTGFDDVRVLAGSLQERKFLAAYRRADRMIGAVGLNTAKQVVRCRRLLEDRVSWAEAMTSLGAPLESPRPTTPALGRAPKGEM